VLSLTRHQVPWPELSEPLRIAQLTDVHMGPSTPTRFVERAVQQAADQADLLVFTGDAVNVLPFPARRFARMLSRVGTPCLAVLGNHDHLAGAGRISGYLRDAGVTVLRNAHTRFGGLTIVGVDDGKSRHAEPARAFQGVDDPRAALVLTHYPPSAERIAPLGGRVILAGHTHGGQARLPGVPRTLAQLWSGDRYVHGWYPVGASRLYVSAGLGHGPLRVGIPPELAVFTLTPEPDGVPAQPPTR